MAEFRVPFTTTAELAAPFRLDEAAVSGGRKRILFNTGDLQVVAKSELINSDIGEINAIAFHVVGTIDYLCHVYPIIASDPEDYTVLRFNADFDNQTGTTAPDCAVATAETPALGWLSSAGSKNVDVPIGATTCFTACDAVMPQILNVTVEDYAVANNITPELFPTCGEDTEEPKRVVKWKGVFVITTSDV